MAYSGPVMTRADALKVGDIVDLQNDPIANASGRYPEFEFELSVVCEIDPETPDCIAIYFEGSDGFGFPPDHMFELHDHDPSYDS